MSVKTVRSQLIVCDGCGAEFGQLGDYDLAGEARHAALRAGWRLVPRIRSSGRVARMDGMPLGTMKSVAYDACPTCPDDHEGFGGATALRIRRQASGLSLSMDSSIWEGIASDRESP